MAEVSVARIIFQQFSIPWPKLPPLITSSDIFLFTDVWNVWFWEWLLQVLSTDVVFFRITSSEEARNMKLGEHCSFFGSADNRSSIIDALLFLRWWNSSWEFIKSLLPWSGAVINRIVKICNNYQKWWRTQINAFWLGNQWIIKSAISQGLDARNMRSGLHRELSYSQGVKRK